MECDLLMLEIGNALEQEIAIYGTGTTGMVVGGDIIPVVSVIEVSFFSVLAVASFYSFFQINSAKAGSKTRTETRPKLSLRRSWNNKVETVTRTTTTGTSIIYEDSFCVLHSTLYCYLVINNSTFLNTEHLTNKPNKKIT